MSIARFYWLGSAQAHGFKIANLNVCGLPINRTAYEKLADDSENSLIILSIIAGLIFRKCYAIIKIIAFNVGLESCCTDGMTEDGYKLSE